MIYYVKGWAMLKKLIIIFFISIPMNAFKLTRVIVASDANSTYIEFWPIVASVWQKVTGLKPTLAFIGDESFPLSVKEGDVIRFTPIKGIPTSTQAQCIRLLLPALFPDDFCLISDIDMIPLQKKYFIDSVNSLPEDCFAVYRNKAYGNNYPQYPMCYLAAQGKTFAEIFNVHSKKDIQKVIKEWHAAGYGYTTDERMLYHKLHAWAYFNSRCILLNHEVGPRIDRVDWRYDKEKLHNGHYIDSHMLRPYSKYKKEIDQLISELLKS